MRENISGQGPTLTGGIFAILVGESYAFTRDPLYFIHPSTGSFGCGEGIHVTHNGQPIANVAIKQLGSGTYTFGATNSTGYLILKICYPIGAIITFQATDYGFQLEPHQIVEAVL